MPVGAQLRFAGSTDKPLEIVGVVADTRTEELSQPAEPEIYLPFWQSGAFSKHLVVRAAGDPTALAALVRARAARDRSDVGGRAHDDDGARFGASRWRRERSRCGC